MTEQTPRKKRGGRLIRVLIVLVVFLAIAGGGIAMFWVAPTPPLFDQELTLVAAEQQAQSEGKLVLAVSTANWCLLCQQYKRGALTTESVEEWVTANAVPVYVNVADAESSERLGVEAKLGALPVTTLLRDGVIVAQHVGMQSESELIAWLGDNASKTAPDTPAESAPPS